MSMVESTVMDDDFSPSRRGRRPMVRVEPLIEAIEEAKGRWVLFEMHDPREANSALRQLSKQPHIETSSETRPDSGKNVFARSLR